MKQFEVPYNFAPDFISTFSESPHLDYIKFFYVPSFSSNNNTSTRADVRFKFGYPQTFEEYTKHIFSLQRLAPVCILLQNNATYEDVFLYYALGIRYFILRDDVLAKTLKEKYPDIHLYLSIVRKITAEEIHTMDFSMYDEIVLFFWFNRHLDVIKQLPKKYKYCILVNGICYYKCDRCTEHWFLNADTLDEFINKELEIIKFCDDKRKDLQQTIAINPEDLSLFEPYVNSYKLVDRQAPTKTIITDFHRYLDKVLYPVDNRHTEDYYNLKD